MKVLYLCPDLGIPILGRKGAAVHVRELVGAFTRAGHQVVVAAQMLNKSSWEKPAYIDAPVLQVRPAPTAAAAVQALNEFNARLGVENSLPGELRRILYNKELEAELQRRFESDPPDFIYERASLYATAGVSLAEKLSVPLIVELNAPLALEQAAYRATGLGQLAAQSERWTLSHAQAVVVVSSQLREHVLSLGVPPGKIHVLPNGVDPGLFNVASPAAEIRARWKLNGGPIVGFAGGLRPWHGVEVLPQLLQRLAGRYPAIQLLVAGDGPMRKDLESALDQRGLRSRAIITGLLPHEQMPAVIRHFDIALAPYPLPDHPFYFSPLKLFEYMACGVAVIAPNLGQIAEVVHDGKTGLLYPAGDFDALAESCERLLSDKPLREKLGHAAASLIQKQFTWDQNAERIAALAKSLSRANNVESAE